MIDERVEDGEARRLVDRPAEDVGAEHEWRDAEAGAAERSELLGHDPRSDGWRRMKTPSRCNRQARATHFAPSRKVGNSREQPNCKSIHAEARREPGKSAARRRR